MNTPNKTKIITKQTREENTRLRHRGEIREHISNGVIIGLANIFSVSMNIKVPKLKDGKKPETFHNLIVENASICSNAPAPSLGSTRIEKRDRANHIFNELSTYVEERMKEVVQMMNGNIEKLIFMKTKQRPSSLAEKLKTFLQFEPFNQDGMLEFGKRVIDIIVDELENIHVDKKHSIVKLEGGNELIINTFYDMLENKKECFSISSESIQQYFYYLRYQTQNNNNKTQITNEISMNQQEGIEENQLIQVMNEPTEFEENLNGMNGYSESGNTINQMNTFYNYQIIYINNQPYLLDTMTGLVYAFTNNINSQNPNQF